MAKDQTEEVLIVRNNETGQVGAVTGLNEDGTPKITDPMFVTLEDLVKFKKGQNPLEAFLSNFVRQCKNPTMFGFFKVPADRYDCVGMAMCVFIKDPETADEDHHKVTGSGEQCNRHSGAKAGGGTGCTD